MSESDESDDESRANRLRDRRRRSRDRGRQQEQEPEEPAENETEETDETSEPSKPSQPSKPDKRREGGGTSVKDEQVGTYMYLPETLVEELGYQFKIQSAEFERATGTELEKNRHWYPLVVSLGLAAVEEMDPEELADHLSSLSDAS